MAAACALDILLMSALESRRNLSASSALTYDLANHEDEADGRSDVEFLPGHQLILTVLACCSRRFVGAMAVGADRALQLHATSAAGYTSIFQG